MMFLCLVLTLSPCAAINRLSNDAQRQIQIAVEQLQDEHFMVSELANISQYLLPAHPNLATPKFFRHATESAMSEILLLKDKMIQISAWSALNDIRDIGRLRHMPTLTHGLIDAFRMQPEPPRSSMLRTDLSIRQTNALWKRVQTEAGERESRSCMAWNE